MSSAGFLVIGVGNRFRGDDGVGPWVADHLHRRGARAVEASGEGAGLIDLWSGSDTAVVVDAMRQDGAPGTIRCFDAHETQIPAGSFHYSSHLFGLAEAIAMARELGRLPRRLTVYGIEGDDFSAGERLSSAVRMAAERVADRIAREIAGCNGTSGQSGAT